MIKNTWTDSHSYGAIIVLFVIIFSVFFGPVLRYDGILYVSPARSLLVNGDLNTYDESGYYSQPGWNSVAHRTVTGKAPVLVKYVNAPDYTSQGYRHVVFPIGNSLTWLPPMAMTYLLMNLTDDLGHRFVNDGFSTPFIVILGWFSFFLGVCGSVFAYKFLRFMYSPGISFSALAFGISAGNIIPFITRDVTFSHSIDLFFVNLILLLAIHIQKSESHNSKKEPGWQIHALFGLVCGWIVIVRYQDVFLLLLPAGLYVIDYFYRRRYMWSKWIGFITAFLMVIILQLIYWKILYGQIFIAGNLMGTGGLPSFQPLHPQFSQMFFSRFHGLFSWMPWLLPISLTALLFVRRNRKIGFLFLFIMLIQIYYNASRTEWWNLGFSVRRFSGWSIFFMIGTAELILLLKHRIVRVLAAVAATGVVTWNWIFMIHYHMGHVPGSIFPEIIKGLGPYGRIRYGIVFPDIQMFVTGIKGLKIWFLRHAWTASIFHWMNAGFSRIAIVYIILNCLFLIFIGVFIWWISRKKTIRFELFLTGCTIYVFVVAVILISEDSGARNINYFPIKNGGIATPSQLLRVRADHIFLGENSFVDLSSIPLTIQQTEEQSLTETSWLIGVPIKSESAIPAILEFSALRKDKAAIVTITLDQSSLNCKRIRHPWGQVEYLNDWYHCLIKFEEVGFIIEALSVKVISGQDLKLAAISQETTVFD
ncbi:hypothetical protein K8T06_04330 [bacterium]|nr:hypothetical protein [bacterium]